MCAKRDTSAKERPVKKSISPKTKKNDQILPQLQERKKLKPEPGFLNISSILYEVCAYLSPRIRDVPCCIYCTSK